MRITSFLDKSTFREFVRFVIVGGLATLTDFFLTTLMFFATSLSPNAITTLAFVLAFFVSFFGHRFFTFKKRGNPLSFFVLALCNLGIRNFFVWLFIYILNMHAYISLLLACALVTGITYFVSKFVIFTDKGK
ncbi:MAG: GtrA family protein [Succinivibrio sp.]